MSVLLGHCGRKLEAMIRIDKLTWEQPYNNPGIIFWFDRFGRQSLMVPMPDGKTTGLISLNDDDAFHVTPAPPQRDGFCITNCVFEIDPRSGVQFDLRTNIGNLLWAGPGRLALIGINDAGNQPQSYTLSGEPIIPVMPDAVSISRWSVGMDDADGTFVSLFTRGDAAH